MIKILEFMAFALSAAAFFYGYFYLFQKEIPKYFHFYAWASGCYMLEELWVIINSILGNGSQDGLVTVRLVGFFGCLCFMLSANVNEFDKIVDEGKNRKASKLALLAPAFLLLLYSLYAFSTDLFPALTGFITMSPALFASYYSLKYLLLPEDEMGFLKVTKKINISALVFYGANYLYPLADLHLTKTFMSVYDLILSGILFGIIFFSRKGAIKWKTLI